MTCSTSKTYFKMEMAGGKLVFSLFFFILTDIVGNKTKRRISKRVLQENKARQIFQKMNISYPLIRTRLYDLYFVLCYQTLL